MHRALEVTLIVASFLLFLSVVGGIASGLLLGPYFIDEDHAGSQRHSIKRMLARDRYRAEGWHYWHVQELCFKASWISLTVLAGGAIAAGLAGIKLTVPF